MAKPRIIFFDNQLLVADKPAGMVTQPTALGVVNLQDYCKEWVKVKMAKSGNVFLHAAHRLDKPVSGVVVFAKTSKALSRLNAVFRERKSIKSYRAIIEGSMPEREGTLEHYLSHGDHCAIVVDPSSPAAKRAVLHYKVIEQSERKSVVDITLETGRYHQIRAQCAAIGAPIAGDLRYGSKRSLPNGAIALRHLKIELPHPTRGEWLTFEADSPSLESIH